MTTSSSWRPMLSLVAAAALVLGACGESDESRAKRAAKWTKTYMHNNPSKRGWKVTKISVSDEDFVVVDIRVPGRDVKVVKARPMMERALVVREACPPPTAEVWKILTEDQKLWINLNSPFDKITGTYCQR